MENSIPQLSLNLLVEDTAELKDAKAILSPYEAKFRECYFAVWRRIKELPEKVPHIAVSILKPRSRANIISALMADEVAECFAGVDDNNIVLEDNLGYLQVIIKNRLAVRFKKGDKNGLAHNILTKKQILRLWQQPLELGMDPDIVFIDATYKLDLVEAEIEDMLFNCQHGGHVRWSYSFMDTAAAPMIQIPEQVPVTKKPKIKARNTAAKTKESQLQ